MTELAPAMSRAEFDAAEIVVETGIRTFVNVGLALAAIREGFGYRYVGFSTFEAYLLQRWEMSRQRAYQLMDAAQVVSTIVDSPPPLHEGQAREMVRLMREHPDEVDEAWTEAFETAPGGKLTAAHVAEVVERRLPRPLAAPGSRVLPDHQLLLRYCPDLPTPLMIALILEVCFPDAHTALDLTYGSGGFWDGTARLKVTAHDLNDERAPDGIADFTQPLPYPPRSFDVVCFDPPHLADAGVESIMGQRYGTYVGDKLQEAITRGTREAWRLARLGVLVKVTDHTHDEQLVLETDWVREALGWQQPYEVVHQVRQNVELSSPRWGDQLSARTNGSTCLIFRRGDNRHIRRGPRS